MCNLETVCSPFFFSFSVLLWLHHIYWFLCFYYFLNFNLTLKQLSIIQSDIFIVFFSDPCKITAPHIILILWIKFVVLCHSIVCHLIESCMMVSYFGSFPTLAKSRTIQQIKFFDEKIKYYLLINWKSLNWTGFDWILNDRPTWYLIYQWGLSLELSS